MVHKMLKMKSALILSALSGGPDTDLVPSDRKEIRGAFGCFTKSSAAALLA